MSHEAFEAEQQTLSSFAFKGVVIDAPQQPMPLRSIELAQGLRGRPCVLLLTSECVTALILLRLLNFLNCSQCMCISDLLEPWQFSYMHSDKLLISFSSPRHVHPTGSHPARGPGQFLQDLWPLLHLVIPDTWQHIHGAVQDLLSHLQPGMTAELLPDVVRGLQVSSLDVAAPSQWHRLGAPDCSTHLVLCSYLAGHRRHVCAQPHCRGG